MQQHNTWIHNLLDGELNAHDEPSLFGELSVNADLRTEFKQQLAIRSAVQHDRMALVPPAHLTNTVFSGLGFAAPMAGAAAGAAGGGFLLPWLMKLGLPILAAAAAVGVTMAVSNAPTNQNATNDAIPSAQNAVTTQNASASYAEGMLATLRAENSRLRGALVSTQERLAEEQTQPRQVPPTPPADPVVTPPVASNADLYQRPQSMAIGSVDLTNTMTFDNSRDLQSIETQIMPATMVYTPFPSILVQVRGFASSSLNDVNVVNKGLWYQDIALAGLRELSPNHAIGLEFGWESFAQSFEGTSNGQIIRYEQRPTTFWAGGLYRYTFDHIGSSAFSPFIQAFGGGTQYGPLGRGTVGMQYSPSGPLSFVVGVEGTMLGYKFQDTWFTSSKVGLTYGMAVRL